MVLIDCCYHVIILRMISRIWSRLGKCTFSQLHHFKNNFMSASNIAYIQSLYEQWSENKTAVSPSFAAYFQQLEQGKNPEDAFEEPGLHPATASSQDATIQLKVRLMIDAYRTHGHQFATTNPLAYDTNKHLPGKLDPKILHLDSFAYTQAEYKQPVTLLNFRKNKEKTNGPYTITEIQAYLKEVYCNKVGYQYMHLLSKDQRNFIKYKVQEHMQELTTKKLSKEQQINTLKRLCKDQCFVDFLNNKFGTFKRFGIQGLNSTTSALGSLVEAAAHHGTENIIFGMAHRGRLNALHCVFKKPALTIFRQFFQNSQMSAQQAGDVKYHKGYTNKVQINNCQISLTVLPNPSHLQAVDPLVYGSTRALQEQKNDLTHDKVFGVLIHGDAAIAGQGVVYESVQMQDLKDYTTGGMIHIVMNNQVGFTTNPQQARSSYYCTEIAKAIDAPVLHVNADEPDMLDWCLKLAVDYRYKFKKDIFIDIVGYRRYGHNEQDQPSFTQPLMYADIKNKKPVYETYKERIIRNGIVTKEEVQDMQRKWQTIYQKDYSQIMDKDTVQEKAVSTLNISKNSNTGVSESVLEELFKKLTTWPSDFNIHPTIKKIYQERIKCYNSKEGLDWATMESLAFGVSLYQGYKVRLSGEDVERGTFSHRHALISDQQRDVPKYCFLKAISENVSVCNSHLSEFGVMGFEYGYSITNPLSLVIWQAQFGDFANGAMTIIDNFLVSGQTKWQQQSGLVLSLPHGMDGQGPEHSQARIQRFLQMSDDDCDISQTNTYAYQMQHCNIQIVYCSTSSNYFHALRRQIKREYRKPLVAFNSKKLLKFKPANKPLSDITSNTEFTPLYPDDLDAKHVKKVIFCHGQFYYDLKAKREQLGDKSTALVRIEQIAPYPHEAVRKAVAAYGNVEYYWAQEEHQNYGPWNFLQPRLKKTINKKIGFYGRPASGSTAVGAMKLHKKQEQLLLNKIFS